MGEKDVVDGRDKMGPVAWWERFGVEVPDLQRLAIRILSQISYVGVLYEIGRFWDVRTEHFAKYICDGKTEDLMFLQDNYRLRSRGIGM